MKYLIFKRHVLMHIKKESVLLKSTTYYTDNNIVDLTFNKGEVIRTESMVKHVTFIFLRLL